ncbi:hypothetical protein LIN78_00565 [Leeia sp. TBRC 13508]|uniref:Uncharacterized protein n=1 Tax=Leeia speluncae TaxID=2884804 RepID=A0ABS8D1H5_9NEIS|nr:hypothetical protein [Leeia speluncae]MCB6182048.1 hypothetical protein [Leeia speluncae]
MHTTKTITLADFVFYKDKQPTSIAALLPDFQVSDRIGVVVKQPAGALGVASLLLAASTVFYDEYRSRLGNEPDKLRLYPDYYVFHAGECRGNHAQLDIWPPHKEVIVANDPEQILEAINDRGITRLLVEDSPTGHATFLRETLCSADHRIKTVLAYRREGNTPNANLRCGHSQVVENYIQKMLTDSQVACELSNALTEQQQSARQALQQDGFYTEHYREISLDDALGMMSFETKQSETTAHYLAVSHPNAGCNR